MKKHAALICIISLQFLNLLPASAQSKKDPTLQAPPADVKVDGELKEWGDSLRYYNEEKKLFYTLANDKTDLYITLRLADRMEQTRLLDGGLTISIDTKGKKKPEYTITYPVAEAGAPIRPAGGPLPSLKPDAEGVTKADRDELMRAKLTKLRNIKVTGFKDVESDIITTTNTYGVKVAINYDNDGYLIYEAAIPFKLFNEFKADKDAWAFNFKINGLPKANEYGPGSGSTPSGGGGMGGGGMRGGGGGMGGGMRGGGGGRRGGGGMAGGAAGNPAQDRSELYKSIDFWEKFYLAPVK